MRVFISSVIRGFKEFREAVSKAVEGLSYTVIRSEDFGARTDTPQRACLEAARNADLTVVLLGERYGEPQESGLSATHEEFREARDHGSVAVFVEEGVDPEPEQAAFIAEAREWSTGRNTGEFSAPGDLHSKVTRRLHEHALRMEAGETEPAELTARARSLLPPQPRRSGSRVHILVAGGPSREALSPAQLEEQALASKLTKRALFGTAPIFDPSMGTSPEVVEDRLVLEQDHAAIKLTEQGSVGIELTGGPREPNSWSGLRALIEEDVRESLGAGLEFVSWVLDEIDPLHRLSEVVILGAIEGGRALGWRTREEHAASPNQIAVPLHASDLVVVPDEPRAYPRAALGAGRSRIVEDLLVRLRREFRP